MIEFFLSPIASWLGISVPLCLIVFLLIILIIRG